jgi:transposase
MPKSETCPECGQPIRKKQLTADQREQILSMSEQGSPNVYLAERFGVSEATISRIVRGLNKKGTDTDGQ